jgi:hypothetical protein
MSDMTGIVRQSKMPRLALPGLAIGLALGPFVIKRIILLGSFDYLSGLPSTMSRGLFP